MGDHIEVEIKILKKGDKVIGLWENRLLIQHKDGSAEFFLLEIDENGFPRINDQTWKITEGHGEIHIEKFDVNNDGKKTPSDDSVKVITF